MLSNADIAELVALRRDLHASPEVSGQERDTAARIAGAFDALRPHRLLTGLGGHGVAAAFVQADPGPTVMLRAELDALPIAEMSDRPWRSAVPGTGHLCGHDGHLAMLLGAGRLLRRDPPTCGRVVLMAQPAEETGAGARAVTHDPRFADIRPDWAFAVHNLPGQPLGHAAIRSGLMNCASRGLALHFAGKTAHAAEPEAGISPATAIAGLIPGLTALGPGGPMDAAFPLVTITHISMGEPAFGIAPGGARLYLTLRSGDDSGLEALTDAAVQLASDAARDHGLDLHSEDHDVFAASVNHPDATAFVVRALDHLSVPWSEAGVPMRASEDFGLFGHAARAAMIGLGAGTGCPALHNPDYDFPDDLIPVGAAILDRVARDILNG